MANVEHNVLTGVSLHEPKGVAAASANEVYVADGAASGSHKQITPTNLVMVHSASDFPTAAAGVRTLVASTVYWVVGAVSIGSDRLVMSADTSLFGINPEYDTLTTTNAGNMITSADDGRISGLGFICTSGAWISISGATNTKRFTISNCIVISCDTVGTVDQSLYFALINSEVRASLNVTAGGLVLSGTGTDLRIMNNRFDIDQGPFIDFAASIWSNAFVGFNVFDNASGEWAITLNVTQDLNIVSTGVGYIVDNMILTIANDIENEGTPVLWNIRTHT